MIQCKASIEIDRAQPSVFAFVDDAAKAPQWLGMCHSLEVLSPPPKRVGTQVRYSYKEGRRVRSMEGSITAYESPRRLEMTLGDKLFEIVVIYEFEASGSGTRFDVALNITPRSFFMKLMGPILRGATQRQATKDVATLKRLLESSPR